MSREKTADSLDFIAGVFEPVVNITTNEKVKEAFRKDRKSVVSAIVSECKEDALQVIEAFDKAEGVDIEYNGITLFKRLLEIVNNYGKDFAGFFGSPDQQTVNGSSGSPMENTEE